MFSILCFLIAMPNFSSVIDSEYSSSVFHVKEISSGYLAFATLASDWGGAENLIIYGIDEYGFVNSSELHDELVNPVKACDLQSGVVVVCNEPLLVTSFSNYGVQNWQVFLPELLSNFASVCLHNTDLILAGNNGVLPKVVKLDELGVFEWEITLTDSFEVIDVTSYEENIFVLGVKDLGNWESEVCIWKLNSAGNTLDLQIIQQDPGLYNPVVIDVVADGIFLLENALTSLNGMISERVLIKLDSDYQIEWTRLIAGSSWERAVALFTLSDNSVVTVGWTNSLLMSESNRSDLFLTKTGSGGDEIWTRRYGTSSTDYGLNVAPVSDNGFVLGGCVTDGFYNGWILKTDSSGFLEPQGIENSKFEEIDAELLLNPSTQISLVVNSGVVQDGSVVLFDLSGRMINRQSCVFNIGENFFNFSGEYLQTGLFFVKVTGVSGEQVLSIVVCEE